MGSGTVESWGWYRQDSIAHKGVLGQKSDSDLAPFAELHGSLCKSGSSPVIKQFVQWKETWDVRHQTRKSVAHLATLTLQ